MGAWVPPLAAHIVLPCFAVGGNELAEVGVRDTSLPAADAESAKQRKQVRREKEKRDRERREQQVSRRKADKTKKKERKGRST